MAPTTSDKPASRKPPARPAAIGDSTSAAAVEASVARHYTHGDLEQILLGALAASGMDLDRLTAADLAPIDEFHIGGLPATSSFADQLAFKAGAQVLDVGCGIGGPARYFAGERGCRVTGIDLTEEFVKVAESLSRRVGLAERTAFRHASALALPFPDASFDGAVMMHVGMNIEDKPRLFAEVRRALRPGAVFGIYDIMRMADGDLAYPVPWASTPATSFPRTPADYRRMLKDAGFKIAAERNRSAFAIAFFEEARARAAQGAATGTAPAPGVHLIMGADFPTKAANTLANLEKGLIAPIEILAKAV
jgi:SAM-dependent methyltransferase